ncbi:hypothetical protein [Hymenobacter rubripertinctus]|uniref:Uncharacterized protein n=1 Tax=Hymenobacter rubripertinctus TaxID=2029981 RepID=A0A418QT39_9BACT|nr:hypothetical protein [Hymenobacter rubripertinctus]RIY08416.1 hypothetical protein D0T11_14340 [Hymenobacter rubripertinctus]
MTNDDLQQASAWTRNYRDQNPNGIKAHCLSAETLQGILSQSGCVGVRAYYGLDEVGAPKLVLVGYDANQHDILPASPEMVPQSMDGRTSADETDLPVSISINNQPCPPCCSLQNTLNS